MFDNIPNVITHIENVELDKEVEENDVLVSIWDLEPNKALGLDGFSIYFYTKFWRLIKKSYAR